MRAWPLRLCSPKANISGLASLALSKCPFIAIEILSPDDRMAEVRNKLQEYADWGVAHVWLIDPHMKRLYLCRDGLHEVPSYQLPEIKLSVTPADLFD